LENTKSETCADPPPAAAKRRLCLAENFALHFLFRAPIKKFQIRKSKIALDSNLFSKKVAAKEIFGSNLLLQNKLVRASAPKILNSAGGNQWDARSASHQKVGLLSETRILEPTAGIEPATYSFVYTFS